MGQLLRRAWHALRRRKFESELADEIEFHRAMTQQDLEANGLGTADPSRPGHQRS
jgi:hypothetical protein